MIIGFQLNSFHNGSYLQKAVEATVLCVVIHFFDKWIDLPPAWILITRSSCMKPPNSSQLNRMCTDTPLSIHKRFFECQATLTSCCDSNVSTILLISLGSGNNLLIFLRLGDFVFTLLGVVGNCIVTLLNFLFFWFIFFWVDNFWFQFAWAYTHSLDSWIAIQFSSMSSPCQANWNPKERVQRCTI